MLALTVVPVEVVVKIAPVSAANVIPAIPSVNTVAKARPLVKIYSVA
jgi:hypothetical protein